jgi:hypothetical protein
MVAGSSGASPPPSLIPPESSTVSKDDASPSRPFQPPGGLIDAISQRRFNVDELWRQAQAQRMQRVMVPYLEALL